VWSLLCSEHSKYSETRWQTSRRIELCDDVVPGNLVTVMCLGSVVNAMKSLKVTIKSSIITPIYASVI
jgi:hypothetical protein